SAPAALQAVWRLIAKREDTLGAFANWSTDARQRCLDAVGGPLSRFARSPAIGRLSPSSFAEHASRACHQFERWCEVSQARSGAIARLPREERDAFHAVLLRRSSGVFGKEPVGRILLDGDDPHAGCLDHRAELIALSGAADAGRP